MAKGRETKRNKKSHTNNPINQTQSSVQYIIYQGEKIELVLTQEYPYQILTTNEYESWIDGIADINTHARITYNVNKMRRGLLGDWKEVNGIFEMRLDFGPGYRIYYVRYSQVVIILLAGGDKDTQKRDIETARMI